MTLANGIYATLHGNTGVAALVADRIYPVQAEQGAAMPLVVWLIVASIPDVTHDAAAAGIDDTMIQFSCYGSNYDDAVALRKGVRTAIDGQALASGQQCSVEMERDLFEAGIDAHHAVLEVRVWRDALAT